MQEIWKDINGYEGLYQVSNLGSVKSLSRTIGNKYKCGIRLQKENRIIKPCKKDNGYLYVSLTKNRIRNNKYIHRLVAEAFINQQDGKNVVNHKDYDVTNNKADNLEWVTPKENVLYSLQHMKHPKEKSIRVSSTGYKYIGKKNGRYRVCIKAADKGTYDKTFDDFEEALLKRNEVMDLWQIVFCKQEKNVI